MEEISYTVNAKRGERMKNKKLKLARVEKELSQAELAEKVGVTRQTIGLIEAGGYNPTLNLCHLQGAGQNTGSTVLGGQLR